MPARIAPGDAVQTPFGKGVVRDVRNNGRLLVEVQGRALVVSLEDVTVLDADGRRSRSRGGAAPAPAEPARPLRRQRAAAAEIDLHGMTVAEALAVAERALNEALLADLPELRFIHGRSGGRIRAALHRRLGDIPSVRAFHLDPANDGVTIARL